VKKNPARSRNPCTVKSYCSYAIPTNKSLSTAQFMTYADLLTCRWFPLSLHLSIHPSCDMIVMKGLLVYLCY